MTRNAEILDTEITMSDQSSFALVVSGLTKRFAGHTVVDDVSFSVKKVARLLCWARAVAVRQRFCAVSPALKRPSRGVSQSQNTQCSMPPQRKIANNAVTAKVVTSSFQGLQNEYLLDVGQGVLVRALHPDINVQRGADVEMAIAPDHIMVWRKKRC